MSGLLRIPGHCGTCGIATDRLPCWSCELERRIVQQNHSADRSGVGVQEAHQTEAQK